MKTLYTYINESLLDDEDQIMNDFEENVKLSIKEFLEQNFKCSLCKISKLPNNDGKFIVNAKHVEIKNNSITALTNGKFVWGVVTGNFSCEFCKNLISLEGAPKKVGRMFDCECCLSLTSLEGAPEEVGWDFHCSGCKSLTSLKGAPREVGGSFGCMKCHSLTSLEGAPEKIGGNFYCSNCKSLTSLKGAPENIGGDLYS